MIGFCVTNANRVAVDNPDFGYRDTVVGSGIVLLEFAPDVSCDLRGL